VIDMKKGFLSIDAFITFFLLISIFMVLIDFTIKNKETIIPWTNQLQVIGSVVSNGYVINEISSDDLNNGKEKNIYIPYDKYYDPLENKNKDIEYSISNYVLYVISNGNVYSTPVFAKSSEGTKITLLSGGGQKISNLTKSLNFVSCEGVLRQIQNGTQYYFTYRTIDKRPWNCDDSCMGGYDDCAYNCDPTTGLDCNIQCSLVDADLKNLKDMNGNTNPTDTTTISNSNKNIGFVIKGPYYNSSLIINDTCGYFPSLDPECNKDFSQYNMRELFVYAYKFNLSSYPMSEIYLNFKARNGVIVEINNKTITCVATGDGSQRAIRIRKYLKLGENIIKIGFIRTDSICNPCVTVRPAYSIGGAVQFTCDPGLPSYTVKDYFGWYGCKDSITLTDLVRLV